MVRSRFLTIAAAFLSLTIAAAPIVAQSTAGSSSWSQEDTVRIINDVQHKLGGLTNYAVFDWITFGIKGKTITLNGFASRPTLKDEAGRAVKSISGVASVDNQIEVLPDSPNDDRVRAAVYNRIYSASTLSKYNANAGRVGRGASVARMAGGITADPPLGYHAIHIIVKNGNVSLYGVVLNQTDASIAGMQANSAPGAFSISNHLVVEGSHPKEGSK
jgi:osmotically-inducible protein OsmY